MGGEGWWTIEGDLLKSALNKEKKNEKTSKNKWIEYLFVVVVYRLCRGPNMSIDSS